MIENDDDDQDQGDDEGGTLALIEAAGAAAKQAGEAQLIVAGSFAIYANGKGGLVLVTEIPGYPVQRKKIPAAFIKMAFRGPMGRLFRRNNGGTDGMD